MSICMAVVGAGRMGSVVAGQLPKRTKKIIIDIDPEKASRLAETVGGIPSDSLESANEADLVAVKVSPFARDSVFSEVSSSRAISNDSCPTRLLPSGNCSRYCFASFSDALHAWI